jgi:UDP-glucuronate 4-epimerase
MSSKILITGIAGFIGHNLVKTLLNDEYDIVGLDNINDYYDPELKYARLNDLGFEKTKIVTNELIFSEKYSNLKFIKLDILEADLLQKLFIKNKFDYVVHLAAQAGVRYSLENPLKYINSNLVGFFNILEFSRIAKVKHFLYASTSSVYGLNSQMPLNEDMITDHPVSLYAATKKSNELMAHSYSHLYGMQTTGLRFFTVYGEWGRPDMALFLFTKALLDKQEINLFNNGEMYRDYTYIQDITLSIKYLLSLEYNDMNVWDKFNPSSHFSSAPYRIYNIGNSSPVNLMDCLNILEKELKIKGRYNFLEIQKGDVFKTHSNTDKLKSVINFVPNTPLEVGISNFVNWYKNYYNK